MGMRLRTAGILALLTVLALAGPACSPEAESQTEPSPRVFESTDGRFSAEFPAEPQEDTQNTSVEGFDLQLHIFTAESEEYAVSVGYVDYPQEVTTVDPNLVLSGVAPGAAANIGGEVTKNEPGTFMGSQSVDYEIAAEGANLQAKAFLVDNRMYLLQAISEELSDSDAEYDRLVESFKLL